MEGDLLIVGAFAVWHVSMLSSVTLYLGSLAETWFVPRHVITSKYHILGLLALSLGLAVIVGSAHMGLLTYGIFIGGALVIADALLTYRACIEWSRFG